MAEAGPRDDTTCDRIVRFSLTSADPPALAAFYRDVLGFLPGATLRVDAARYGVAGLATVHRLTLGAQAIELVGFDRPGRPYPAGSSSHDGWFQHLALVTHDIDAAWARLRQAAGVQAISRSPSPVRLPAASGGVAAFKFRDPEGHPLELLGFPPGGAPPAWQPTGDTAMLSGIDHSAIVAADLDASLAFYARHGFVVAAASENAGPEQDALDAAEQVAVSVRALSRPAAPPRLELLGYRTPPVSPGAAGPADVACTRTVLSGRGGLSTDPDGHVILFDAA